MADDFPSRSLDKIVIRLPDGLRGRIREAAKISGRSMNAEIVSTLTAAYPKTTNAYELLNDLLNLMHHNSHKIKQDDFAEMNSIYYQLSSEIARLDQIEQAHTKTPSAEDPEGSN